MSPLARRPVKVKRERKDVMKLRRAGGNDDEPPHKSMRTCSEEMANVS